MLCGCVKKDLYFPETSPSPIDTAKFESGVGSKCGVRLDAKMSLEEIAVAVGEMRRICNYSKTEILNSAQNVF